MGGIVSSQRRKRPESAQSARKDDAGAQMVSRGPAQSRPTSAPPALVIAAERDVEMERREQAIRRVQDLQDERVKGSQVGRGQDRSTAAISPEQAIRLDRKINEALVDQMLHEGQGMFERLAPDDAATLLKSVGGPLAGALRLQASSKGFDLLDKLPSPQSTRSGLSSPLRDISNVQGASPKRRVLPNHITAAELEEADRIVAEHLSPVAGSLREQVGVYACLWLCVQIIFFNKTHFNLARI